MKKVILKFQYTKDEYVKAERQYLIANKTIRKYDFILVAGFLLFSIGYLFYSSFSIFSILILGIILAVTALGSYLYFLMPIQKFRETSKYQTEYTLIFATEYILFKTPSIESEMTWDNYSDLWESNDFYFLIQAARMYALIPKRAFQTPAAQQTFEEIVLSNLKISKRVL